MTQPYNYNLRPMNLAGDVLGGLKAGQQVRAEEIAQQGAIQKQQAESQKQDRAKELQTYLGNLAAKPTASGITSAMIQYPELAEKLNHSLSQLSDKEKAAKISLASKVYHGVKSGSPAGIKASIKLLEDSALALEDKGDTQGAKDLRAQAINLEENPESVEISAGMFLAGALGQDKFMSNFEYLDTRGDKKKQAKVDLAGKKADTELKTQQTEEIKEKIRMDGIKFKADSLKEKVEGKRFEKLASKEAQGFRKSSNQALEANSIAMNSLKRLQSKVPGLEGKVGGAWTTLQNKALDYFEGVSDPKRAVIVGEINEIRMRRAFALKQAGAMSNEEFQAYMSSQLPANAKAEAITEYLSNLEEISNSEYGYHRLKTGFLNKNLDLEESKTSFKPFPNAPSINKGEIFDDYIRRIGSDLKIYIPEYGGSSNADTNSKRASSFLNQFQR